MIWTYEKTQIFNTSAKKKKHKKIQLTCYKILKLDFLLVYILTKMKSPNNHNIDH